MPYAPLVVQDYDPAWPRMYAATEAAILRAIGDQVAAIAHIGSTAVPGLVAKPLIDVLVALRRFPADIAQIGEPLAGIGFASVPKPWPDRYFFRRGPWGHGTHHLHVVAPDGEDWTRQLRFRDYLRAHPAAAARYAALKRDLAATFRTDRGGYTAAKGAFIAAILAAAREQHPGGRAEGGEAARPCGPRASAASRRAAPARFVARVGPGGIALRPARQGSTTMSLSGPGRGAMDEHPRHIVAVMGVVSDRHGHLLLAGSCSNGSAPRRAAVRRTVPPRDAGRWRVGRVPRRQGGAMGQPEGERPIINIAGERVALGPLRRDLVPLYQRWVNDFEIAHNFGQVRPLTEDQEQAWYDRQAAAEQGVTFTVYERATWRPIGTTNLHAIDHRNGTATFGVGIGEADCRGKGYGTEVARLMLDYAFAALGLHSVMLIVFAYNLAGQRAYAKAGFREIGRRRQAYRLGGRWWDIVYMDCLAAEFTSPVLGQLFMSDTSRVVPPRE